MNTRTGPSYLRITSVRPRRRSSAPNTVLKNPRAISASLNVLRSAARRALISASSPPAGAPLASRRAPNSKIKAGRTIRAGIMAHRPCRAAGLRSGGRREPGGARLQGADAIRKAALGILDGDHGRILRACHWRRAVGGGLSARRGRLGQNGIDRRIRALQRGSEPRDLGRDVIDAFAQQRILDPLGRPRRLSLALHGCQFALQLCPLFARALELALDERLVGAQRFGGGVVAAVERRQLAAQIGFDPPRRLDLEPELVALAFALRELAALCGEMRLEL